MNLPDKVTWPPASDFDAGVWYRSFQQIVNSLPQMGSVAPEGRVAANASCLYVQTSAGTTLWFNESGSGSKTGWVAK